eukprot:scaffold30101_cov20-Tisochrysis_lutea.AAC.1
MMNDARRTRCRCSDGVLQSLSANGIPGSLSVSAFFWANHVINLVICICSTHTYVHARMLAHTLTGRLHDSTPFAILFCTNAIPALSVLAWSTCIEQLSGCSTSSSLASLSDYIIEANEVPAIINSKAGLKYTGRHVDAMKLVAKAYQDRSLQEFQACLGLSICAQYVAILALLVNTHLLCQSLPQAEDTALASASQAKQDKEFAALVLFLLNPPATGWERKSVKLSLP